MFGRGRRQLTTGGDPEIKIFKSSYRINDDILSVEIQMFRTFKVILKQCGF